MSDEEENPSWLRDIASFVIWAVVALVAVVVVFLVLFLLVEVEMP